ncbi:MAG: hypothetical protein WCW77_02940 [Patescibacteria group bacterium]|jgi:hypothetical protein
MPNFEIRKLREYYNSLKGVNKVLEDLTKKNPTWAIDGDLVLEYEKVINQANTDLPGLLAPFSKNEFFAFHSVNGHAHYKPNGIKANIARNLGIIKSEIDDTESIPVITEKSFDFIEDEKIKKILERDYLEIQRNLISTNWKSTILLSGGSIEAILLDLLKKDQTKATSSSKAPHESDLNKWDLNSLVEVAVEENFIGSEIAKLSHTIREYRNLIHPGVEIRNHLKVEPEEAKIAIEVLNILVRELSG